VECGKLLDRCQSQVSIKNIKDCECQVAKITSKICTQCEIEKSLDEFYNQKFGKYGKKAECKRCTKKYRDKQTAADRKELKLKSIYGMTPFDYWRMVELQDNKCCICGQKEAFVHNDTKRPTLLSVDHCHVTGKIRGLLCRQCNQMLGNAKDIPAVLVKGAEYLERNVLSNA
jgi:hypothetical protein